MNLYPSGSGLNTPFSSYSPYGMRRRDSDLEKGSEKSIEVEELFSLLQPTNDKASFLSSSLSQSRSGVASTRTRSRARSLSLSIPVGHTMGEEAGQTGVWRTRPSPEDVKTRRTRAISLPSAPLSPLLLGLLPPPSSPTAEAMDAAAKIESVQGLAISSQSQLSTPPLHRNRQQSHKQQMKQQLTLLHAEGAPRYSSPSPSPSPSLSPSPSPSPSPLQREHTQHMSRILSHYSDDRIYRKWKGAVRSQSDYKYGQEETKESADIPGHRISQSLSFIDRHYRSSFLSPLAVIRKRSGSNRQVSEEKSSEEKTDVAGTVEHGVVAQHADGEDENAGMEWRERCRAMSGEHDQLLEWEAQRRMQDDSTTSSGGKSAHAVEDNESVSKDSKGFLRGVKSKGSKFDASTGKKSERYAMIVIIFSMYFLIVFFVPCFVSLPFEACIDTNFV